MDTNSSPAQELQCSGHAVRSRAHRCRCTADADAGPADDVDGQRPEVARAHDVGPVADDGVVVDGPVTSRPGPTRGECRTGTGPAGPWRPPDNSVPCAAKRQLRAAHRGGSNG